MQRDVVSALIAIGPVASGFTLPADLKTGERLVVLEDVDLKTGVVHVKREADPTKYALPFVLVLPPALPRRRMSSNLPRPGTPHKPEGDPPPKLKLSREQQTVFEYLVNNDSSVRIEGGAGVGKTFTALYAFAVRSWQRPYELTSSAFTHRMVNNMARTVKDQGAASA